MGPEGPSQGDKFKTKIEEGIDRAFLPAERVKDLKDEVKTKTEKSNKMKREIKEAIKKGFTAEATKDLAISPGEKQLIFKSVVNSLTSSLGSPEAAKALLKKFGINSAGDLMRKIGLSRTTEQKTYEKYMYYAKKGPGMCFKDYDEIITQPWGKKVLDKALQTRPEMVFAFANKFTKLPEYGHKLLMQASTKSPKLAFHYVGKFKKMDGADKILINALARMDKMDTAFKFLGKYKDMKNVAKVLGFAASQEPELAFKNLGKLKKLPGEAAKDVLIAAVNASKDMKTFFENSDKLKGIPGAEIVLILANQRSENENMAFFYIEKYADMPEASTVLINALTIGADPQAAFTALKGLEIAGIQDVCVMAATFNPEAAFTFIDSYKHLPAKTVYAVLGVAVANKPELALTKIKKLGSLNNKKIITKILADAVTHKPEIAFEEKYLENLQELPAPFLESFQVKAAALSPTAAVESFGTMHKSQKVLVAAAKNLKPKEFINATIYNILKQNLKKSPYKTKMLEDYAQKHADCKEIGKNILNTIHGAGYEAFFSDPSLQHVLKVKTDWIDPKPKEFSISKARVMIARYIYESSEKEPNKSIVENAWKNILESRNKYKKVTLFKDRNIIYLSDNEFMNGKTMRRFGSKSNREKMLGQGAKSLTHLIADYPDKASYEVKIKQLIELKKNLTQKIINTPPPLTLYYAGHGGSKLITLENNLKFKPKDEHHGVFSAKEIANCLSLRHKKYPNEHKNVNTKQINIFSTCNSSTLLRNINKRLDQGTPLPISLGTAEHKQTTPVVDSEFGGDFESKVINLPRATKDNPSTIGMVMRYEDKMNNNPTLFASNDTNQSVQLT